MYTPLYLLHIDYTHSSVCVHNDSTGVTIMCLNFLIPLYVAYAESCLNPIAIPENCMTLEEGNVYTGLHASYVP